MGLLDNFANAPAESGFNDALLAAAQALLTPRARGGGMGAAFGAFPQAMQRAQQQQMQNRLFGLKERALDAEMSEAERKRLAYESAAANRTKFLQAMQQNRGPMTPALAALGIEAGMKPADLKEMAGMGNWGREKLVWQNGIGLEPYSGQPQAVAPNVNQPFIPELNNGRITAQENTPYQRFKLTDSKASAPSTTVSNYIMPATPGQEAADKKFAADFVEFATGGYADVQKQLNQLRDAAAALRSGEQISGPVIGSMPDSVLAFTNEKAVSTKEAIQEVAQRNLRLILGAQFTEKEGERLIARVYNPRLSEAENAKRLDRLITQISTAAQAKLDAAEYFRRNGSLTGWQGKLPSLADFEPDFVKGGVSGSFAAPKDEKPASPTVDDLLKKYGN